MTTFQRLCLYILSVVALLILVTIRDPRLDRIYPTYIVERGYEYLDTKAVLKSGAWQLKTEWTTIRDDANRYGDYDTALEDAREWGGQPVTVGRE